MNKRKEVHFWTNEDEKTVKINQSKLIYSLNNLGYANLKINPTNYMLIKCNDNKISRTSEQEIIYELNQVLKEKAPEVVQEVFIRGIGNYISPKKLNFLNTLEFSKEKDKKDSSYFFFKNQYCFIDKNEISASNYEKLNFRIWDNKIIDKDFNFPDDSKIGDFEMFCRNITSNDGERFLVFKIMVGYLLHRNKEVGEPKAVILYDADMGINNQAHGGTGKTIIIKALELMRELVYVSGKDMKTSSFFKNQRINVTTELIAYDDLKENINFEEFYTLITSGIEVEQKGKQSFFIPFEDSPKLILSSNYIIKGDGGNSDLRRRYEFEIANFYSKNLTPEMEFGKRFFSNDWDAMEWNKFYFFMMDCVREYLKNGLVEANPINLNQNKIFSKTNKEFIEFADKNFITNNWINKREIEKLFRQKYTNYSDLSPHRFSKWIEDYSIFKNLTYTKSSTGSEYLFKLSKKEVVNE